MAASVQINTISSARGATERRRYAHSRTTRRRYRRLVMKQRPVRGLARLGVASKGTVVRVRRKERVVVTQRIRTETRPPILSRPRNHAGAHRIEFDVAHAGKQVTPDMHRDRLVAILPQRAVTMVDLIDVTRVTFAQGAHQAGDAARA